MTLTNDEKYLIIAALNDKIKIWENARNETQDYPRLSQQFQKQIDEADRLIEKIDEEGEDAI